MPSISLERNISFIIGIAVGYGIRYIVQLFKDAPKDEKAEMTSLPFLILMTMLS